MAQNFFKVNRGAAFYGQASGPSDPQNGDFYYDSVANTFRFYHNGAWVRMSSVGSVASAANLTSSNFTSTITENSIIRITGIIAGEIHGLAASSGAKVILIYNGTNVTQTLKHQSGTELTAANRIVTPSAGDSLIPSGYAAQLFYDASVNRWAVIQTTAASSGGGGGSLQLFENLTEQAKSNPIALAVSGNDAFTETFIDQAKVRDFRLGKSYTTGDTTKIYIHPEYLSVDAMDATTGWTQFGPQAGAPTLNNTDFIQGTGSVQCISSSGTGENGIYKDFAAFSLIGKKLRFAYRIDDLTNVSAIRVRLYKQSGETDGAWFDLTTQASGSALQNNVGVDDSGWNFMEVDVENTTPTGTTGTPDFSSIVRIKIAPILSSAQAHTVQVDDLCSADNREIPTGITMSIYDATNLERFVVASGTNGKYAMSVGLSNNYTNDSASHVRRGKGDLSLHTLRFDSGDTGAVSLRSPFMNRRAMAQTHVNQTLKWACKYHTESFWQVYSAPSSSSIIVKSASDLTTSIPSGTVVWIYRRIWNGSNYEYPGAPVRVTLNASSTWDGVNLRMTLSHNGSFTTSSPSEYWVVVEAMEFRSWVGSLGSQESLVQRTPSALLPVAESIIYKQDDFNRSTSHPSIDNGWTVNTYNPAPGAYQIYANGSALYQYGYPLSPDGPFLGYSCYTQYYTSAVLGSVARFRVKSRSQAVYGPYSYTLNRYQPLGITMGQSSYTDYASGVFAGLVWHRDGASAEERRFSISRGGMNGSDLIVDIPGLDPTNNMWIDILRLYNTLYYKYWVDGSPEPVTYLGGVDITGKITNNKWALTVVTSQSGGNNAPTFYSAGQESFVDSFLFDSGDQGGFILSGQVTNQTGDTIAVGADLIRASTANQSPAIHRITTILE